MARKVDPRKIEKIKQATIEMMIGYGYRGTSISSIAKKAGVSVGYLYRHYSSKEELVEELVDSYLEDTKKSFEAIISKSESIHDLIYKFVSELFELAKRDILKFKFITTILFEYDFDKISFKRKREEKTMEEKILSMDFSRESLNENIIVEDIMIILFTLPFSFIAQRILSEDPQQTLTEEYAQKVAQMCFKALT